MKLTSFFNRMWMVAILLFGWAFAQQAQPVLSVTPDAERSSYVLTYATADTEDFTIIIRDPQGRKLYQEEVGAKNEFARSYRLAEIAAGEYTFEVVQDETVLKQTVAYPIVTPSSLDVDVLAAPADRRYQVLVAGAPEKAIKVQIFNENQELLYETRTTVAEQSNRVFNFEQVADREVFVLISDATHTVKERISLR